MSPTSTPVRSVSFAADLASHGDRVAVVTPERTLTYQDLTDRVESLAARLGTARRLVLMVGGNTLDALCTYLATLRTGNPLLLAPAEAEAALTAAYDPDVVAGPVDGAWTLRERRDETVHDLHPDLALLLSTSGTTGSPKLVRLSTENLDANAEAIATYLDIRPDDRAATTLPMHYCYGLSVVNSHLTRGASLLLTSLSVVDACFWDQFRRARATTFAGVPYTFDLLDRAGFADLDVPTLRYVTQAGGRLAPDRVRHYADLGRRRGWDLFVMYGQTEATARMAYLPPDLATTRPEAIGVPIPGGAFRLDPVTGAAPGAGELVYTGPNVMMGYAERSADLALGHTVHELRTGDLASRDADGIYTIEGRRADFAKVLGLRVDLRRVTDGLAARGIRAVCLPGDHALLVVAEGEDFDGAVDPAAVVRAAAAVAGLPPHAVRATVVPALPRLSNGKPDRKAALALVSPTAPTAGAEPSPDDLRTVFAQVLDRERVTDGDSFVSLGGDSLSYVEMSIRLEQALGTLPADWHTRTIGELRNAVPGKGAKPSRRRTVETGVALRGIAILLVVGSHIPDLIMVKGGAHLLLGAAGFNFARFQLTAVPRGERVRRIASSIRRLAVPSMIFIALAYLLTDDYTPANIVLLNAVLGPFDGATEWNFWFVEALVTMLLAALALVSLPFVDRLERRVPFALPFAVAAVGLITRYDVPGWRERGHVPSAVVAFWLFALGWAAAKATRTSQRIAVTVAVVVTVPGFWGEPAREAVVIAGIALLIWVPRLPSLSVVNSVIGVLAASSLYIYLTHWQVFTRFGGDYPLVAFATCIAVGVAYAALARWVGRWTGGLWTRQVSSRPEHPFNRST